MTLLILSVSHCIFYSASVLLIRSYDFCLLVENFVPCLAYPSEAQPIPQNPL